MKITAKLVASLTLPRGKSDVIHFDDDLPGFGYRLRRGSGDAVRRSWVAQYRVAGGSRRVLIGDAAVLSTEQARAEAKKILAAVTLGKDPQAEKADRRERDRLSLQSVIADYLEMKAGEVRPGTMREVKRYLTGPYFRSLHSMPIDAIERKHVAAAVMAAQKAHSASVAMLARSTLGALFAWGMTMGLCESNPTIGAYTPQVGEPRARVLTDDELVRIWKACEDDDHGRITRLLILLAARRGEVGGMVWNEIDLEGPRPPTWTIPAERSKNGIAHTLPLLPMAMEIIAATPRIVDRDCLFGSRSERGFSAWAEGKAALDARSGVADWRLHDLRRSVATGMANLGTPPFTIEQVLNHVASKTTVARTYNLSSYTNEVRAALALWHSHIESLVSGGARKVVALHSK
jgi:integrase